MGWNGIVFGALIGLSLSRTVWGALIGALIGYLLEQGARSGIANGVGSAPSGNGARFGYARSTAAPAAVFFKTTFELMGYVAKSDGRVSEAEIDAARRLMHELNLGPREVAAAIAYFQTGKAAGYAVGNSIEDLRLACGQRLDLLRAFIELQLRAALAGNGISPPARNILTQAAERLGMSGMEFARLEAAVRARQTRGGAGNARQKPAASSLAECYTELEVAASASDKDVTKAYRRQMSRHHPDKLVANGLPESMAQMAKEKTQRIQEAYETVRAARGMR